MKTFEKSELSTSELIIDAVYRGGRGGGAGDDPLPALLGLSTGGGFRYRGSLEALSLVALTSNKRDPDWPDQLDHETGIYTYYGDNKVPGRSLHDTPRFGNEILQRVFENARLGESGRARVPPILVFTNAGSWRDVLFLGLAIPGTTGAGVLEDLVAIWRTNGESRFQNYRARFTILRTESVPRAWIDSIISGNPKNDLAPKAWQEWRATGSITPLLSPRTIQHRRRKEQLPESQADQEIVSLIHTYFAADPFEFEKCAADLARMMLPNIASLDLTRRSRDGGRDGIGKYRIGNGPSSVLVDFALEAKCYASKNSVGVREVSRLISRLRHRQFGVMVTTSCVDEQAYKEIKEDEHPIVVIAAADIVRLLRDNGYSDASSVKSWLEQSFPADL